MRPGTQYYMLFATHFIYCIGHPKNENSVIIYSYNIPNQLDFCSSSEKQFKILIFSHNVCPPKYMQPKL